MLELMKEEVIQKMTVRLLTVYGKGRVMTVRYLIERLLANCRDIDAEATVRILSREKEFSSESKLAHVIRVSALGNIIIYEEDLRDDK
jgi:primosomal protein N''